MIDLDINAADDENNKDLNDDDEKEKSVEN
jgi:hypothetical protein